MNRLQIQPSTEILELIESILQETPPSVDECREEYEEIRALVGEVITILNDDVD